MIFLIVPNLLLYFESFENSVDLSTLSFATSSSLEPSVPMRISDNLSEWSSQIRCSSSMIEIGEKKFEIVWSKKYLKNKKIEQEEDIHSFSDIFSKIFWQIMSPLYTSFTSFTEGWQSGWLQQSWKLPCRKVPRVRISVPPPEVYIARYLPSFYFVYIHSIEKYILIYAIWMSI